jgi:GAF domain
MTSRVVRIALLLGALGALAAGGFVVFNAERALNEEEGARAMYDAQARAVATDLMQLRTAQQGYVAQGQGTDFWMQRAAEHLSRVDRGTASLAADAKAEGTRTAVQAARAALDNFRALDQRARQYVGDGQALMASDVIFNESVAAATAAGERVEAARVSEQASHDNAISALRWRQLYAAAGAAAVLMIAVLLLAPIPEREVDVISALKALTDTGPKLKMEPAPQTASAQPAANASIPAPLASARVVERPAERAPELFTPPQVPISVNTSLPSSSPPPIDLTKAAKICADLARVLDAGDLPALLTRAADVLKAPGLIVWVADQNGQMLYPLLTHGYPAATLMKVGSLPTDADNATAAAWRTGELRAVPATNEAPGALVAPIVTSDGCVGVLAAEVKDGRELRGEVRALATIFAAQLATIVTPLPAAGAHPLVAEA